MNILGLDKAEILAALYNGSKQQGLGFLDRSGAAGMSVEQAREELDKSERKRFDYLNGRVLKIDLSGYELNTGLYNRGNGAGAAEAIISSISNQVA